MAISVHSTTGWCYGVDMALNRNRERELLSEYAAELSAARSRREEAQAEVDSLEPIVEGLRKRVGEKEPLATFSPTYGGKPIMAAVITGFLADGAVRSVDDVVRHFAEHPAYRDKQPSRTSITNRLNDLVKANDLTRVERGLYQAVRLKEDSG